MAADALLKGPGVAKAALFVALTVSLPGGLSAAQCGGAVVGEAGVPAVIQGLGSSAGVRVWAAGAASTASIAAPCSAGGWAAYDSSTLCDDGGSCIAVTGVQWLNGECQTAGLLPATTVILAEDVTAGDGGRWAAVVVNHNPGDANTDLDAAQDRICGGCSSVASPLIGDGQRIAAVLVARTGDLVTLRLSWSGPEASAEALGESPTSLVTGYSIWIARAPDSGTPTLNGDMSGWTLTPDGDGAQVGGYSTDAAAEIVVDLAGSTDAVWVAVGLIFDGSGDPASDTNSMASNVISRGIQAYVPSIGIVGIFADGFESGGVGAWSDSAP